MAFFLIGKGSEGELTLLAPTLFSTRQDAMAELSRISAGPTFDRWSDEVLVMDVETGTPVLLVRPQNAPAVAAETPAEEPAADAWVADLPREPAKEPVPASDKDVVEDLPPEVAETDAEPAPSWSPAGIAGVGAAAAVAVAAPVALESAFASALQTSSPAEAPSSAAVDEAVDGDSLKDALLRTTERMSAEGIVAPASAGLGDVAAPQGSDSPDAPDDSTLAAAMGAFAEPAVSEAPGAWPWASPDAEATAEPAPEAETASALYDALAEPAAEPAPAEAPIDESGDVSPLVSPITEAHESMSSAAAEEPASPVDSAPESDFILDLDAITPPAPIETEESPVAAEPATDAATEPVAAETTPESAEATVSPLTEYTCDDCVYVATCPNRDQRLPKDCGSFQWR